MFIRRPESAAFQPTPMHHIIAAASKAELQDAFLTGSAYLIAGFAAICFFAAVMAHIFRD